MRPALITLIILGFLIVPFVNAELLISQPQGDNSWEGVWRNDAEGDRCQTIFLSPINITNVSVELWFHSDSAATAGNCWVSIYNGTASARGAFKGNSISNYSCGLLDSDAKYNFSFGESIVLNGSSYFWLCAANTSAIDGVIYPYAKSTSVYANGSIFRIRDNHDQNLDIYFKVFGDYYTPPEVAPADSITLTFHNQTPSDINAFNLFRVPSLEINYNITTTNGTIGNASIFYYVNSSTDCWIYTNGTGTSCGYQNKPASSVSGNTYRFLLGSETEIYPASYMYDEAYMIAASKSIDTISNNSHAFSLTYLNISAEKSYTFFEAYFNATTVGNPTLAATLYYCNSSYNFASAFTSNSNCFAFDSINTNITYNHTHGANSMHILKPIPIINGAVGTVLVTSESHILIKSSGSTNTWSLRYISNISRVDQSKKTTNNGAVWSNIAGTADAHIHQYETTQTLFYTVTANATYVNYTNATTRTDNLDLSLFGISSPQILSPFQDYNTSAILNISFTPALSSQVNNFNYTLQLLNASGSLIQNITSLQNVTTYLWDNMLNVSDYIIKIIARDVIYNQTSEAFSELWHRQARVNITATNALTAAAISNFSVYVNGTFYGTANGNTLSVDGLGLLDYNFTLNASGYSYTHTQLKLSSSFTALAFSAFTTNSIYITVSDESTGAAILQNVSVLFSSTFGEFTNTTNTSILYVENLAAAVYTLLFSSSGYSSRTYTVTVANHSSVFLAAFLAQNTSETLFTISDEDTSALLPDVLITMFRTINGSWSAVESKSSDITGRVQFTYQPNINYKFYLAKPGFNDYVFYLSPILYSSYDITMQQTTLINYSQDFDKLSIIYSPSNFKNNANTTFSMIFASPFGVLIQYGFNASYPGGTSYGTGTNAIGEQLTDTFTISGAGAQDSIRLDYYYITALSGRRNFTTFLSITFPNGTGNYTFAANRDNTYGLTIVERAIIVTVGVIFVVGIAALVGQLIPGIALGIFVLCYCVGIGFISIWLVLPSVFMGALFLMSRAGGAV